MIEDSSLVAPVSSYNSELLCGICTEFVTRQLHDPDEVFLLSQLGSWAQVKWTLISGIILVIFSETLQFPHSKPSKEEQEGSIGARDSQRSKTQKYC